jgi:hypothetical protein
MAPLNCNLLKRRAKMLEMVNKGFHLVDVVTALAEKYHVSQKSLWSDWDRREHWVPILLNLEKYGKFDQVLESKYSAVQKAAWGISARADSDSARVGALRVVLDSLDAQGSAILSREVVSRLDSIEAKKKEEAAKKVENK